MRGIASNIAIAAILTQPDDAGHQHPVAYESRKLTAAERNYPAHILELLAVVHALRTFRHYLLGGGAPRPAGCWTDFDLRTDNQAITWLKTNRHLNKMYVRWLDEIEDSSAGGTRGHPRGVGDHAAHGGGHLRHRSGGGRTPLHAAQGGNGLNSPV